MVFFAIAILAGALTILAPCILPLLPVVIGASESGVRHVSWRSLIVIGSLAVSVIVFTLLLKASTLLITIPPSVWTWFSGGVLTVLGLSLVAPVWWGKVPFIGRLAKVGNSAVGSGYQAASWRGDVLMGVALGPVFSTCSPTYLFIIATVLPASYVVGLWYLGGFVFGLTLALFLVAYFGQQFVSRVLAHLTTAARVRQGLGVLLLCVGVAVALGWDKHFEAYILDSGYGATIQFEEALLRQFAPVINVPSPSVTPAREVELEMGSVEIIATTTKVSSSESLTTRTALFGNGCFWCVEHDLAEVAGVRDVVSGYAGGATENPDYKNYGDGGHREVVIVTYDPQVVTYGNLVEHIIKHGDPTDGAGSFGDRGAEYAPAIYYENDDERRTAERVVAAVEAADVFEKPLALPLLPRPTFYPAEEYHQDYAEKNPLRYGFYRNASGRTAFIEKTWGDDLTRFTYSTTPMDSTSTTPNDSSKSAFSNTSWNDFVRPSDDELRDTLSAIAFSVTRKEGTERAGTSELDINYEPGIYVDIISGEPLFSSRDKYDSGTGWPSFVRPITDDAVTLHEDRKLFSTRTEVRSRYADSHVGHVFDDGPADRGGKRYCMNGVALRFIAKADMTAAGYEFWLQFVE